MVKAQYQIQQLAIMIIAVFIFFVMAGLFFINLQYAKIKKDFSVSQYEKAITSLKVIADSAEINCDESESFCIDYDKLIAFSEISREYEGFWDIASVELLILYPFRNESIVLCPAPNCNYYVLYDSNQNDKVLYSMYVNVCRKIDRNYKICEFGQLLVGIKMN